MIDESIFTDWKALVHENLVQAADVGRTLDAIIYSLAINGCIVPPKFALVRHLQDLAHDGVVEFVPNNGQECGYYKLCSPKKDPKDLNGFGVPCLYLDDRSDTPHHLQIVCWDKRSGTVRYFRDEACHFCDKNGNDFETNNAVWLEAHQSQFIVTSFDVSVNQCPTVPDMLGQCATWIVEPNGELVANHKAMYYAG